MRCNIDRPSRRIQGQFETHVLNVHGSTWQLNSLQFGYNFFVVLRTSRPPLFKCAHDVFNAQSSQERTIRGSVYL